ncbi:hypothetical protein F6X40_24185 [Paraburkholderia sp. UCT31]|uniref:hypothetical protein n=1 Tax=Paraburkholderia sp. UCT31 TaxID=2615209 RepID=UPI0016555A6E|nr:hypothetical protein [Paraburkholderia sp. UCT31]MBC8739817.1 hypothetical protein [Paraburkholderia sp. UCT31]
MQIAVEAVEAVQEADSGPDLSVQKPSPRAKRRADNSRAIARQVRINAASGRSVEKPGRLRKQHAGNCGNPQCAMCGNPRVFFGEKTMQERRFDQPKLHTFEDEPPL